MEHYFIFLCDGNPIEKDQLTTINYIHSILPKRCLLKTDFPLPLLLKCKSVYFSFVTTYLTQEKVPQWTSLKSESNINKVFASFQDSEKRTDESTDDDSLKMDLILSSQLNYLADLLPQCGSYKLDVILSETILHNLTMSENIALSASLFRLFRWHNAHTAILSDAPLKDSTWLNLMDYEIIDPNEFEKDSCLVWRGSIQLQGQADTAKLIPGFHFKWDIERNHPFLKSSSLNSFFDDNEDCSEYLLTSTVLKVIDTCSFNTIPLYMVCPMPFTLSLSEPNISNKGSQHISKLLTETPNTALILRMSYSILQDKPKPNKNLSTSKWLKMKGGDIKNFLEPLDGEPVTEKYITFALTWSTETEQLVAYALRDPDSMDARFCLNASMGQQPSSDVPYADIRLPHASGDSFKMLLRKIATSKTGNASDGIAIKEITIPHLVETFIKNCKILSLALPQNKISSVSIDPSDWPERVYLLKKQMRDEKEKSTPFYLFSPQKSVSNVRFSSGDASAFFEPSGEAKDSQSESILIPNGVVKYNKQEYPTVAQLAWPEVLHSISHDIYYNSDKLAEHRETCGNKLVNLYIQHETASTCNKQQLNPDPIIPMRTHGHAMTPRTFSKLKRRSSSGVSLDTCNPPLSVKRTRKSFAVTPRTFSKFRQRNSGNSTETEMDGPTERLLSFSPSKKKRRIDFASASVSQAVRCSPRRSKILGHSSTSRGARSRKRAVPVRSSPRKSISVDYSSLSISRGVHCNPRTYVPKRSSPRKSISMDYSSPSTSKGVYPRKKAYVPVRNSPQKSISIDYSCPSTSKGVISLQKRPCIPVRNSLRDSISMDYSSPSIPTSFTPRKKNHAPIRNSPRKSISMDYSSPSTFTHVTPKKQRYAPVRNSPRQSISKDFSSPSTSNTVTPRKRNYAPVRNSPRQSISKDYSSPSTSNGVTPKKKNYAPMRNSPRQSYPSTSKDGLPRFSAAVRSSPRKKLIASNASSRSTAVKTASRTANGVGCHKGNTFTEPMKKKLRAAVSIALEGKGISLDHPLFQPCGKRLFTVCQLFVKDMSAEKGRTSQQMQKIADAHVQQVIDFEKSKDL